MRRFFVVLALLGLAACGGDDTPAAPPTTTATTVDGAATTTTASPYSRTSVSTPEDSEQGLLTKVSVGKHDGFTRVVFEFDNLVPGYAVSFAEPPFLEDGRGEEVEVDGDEFIRVRLTARAHNEDGQPTVSTARVKGPPGGVVTEVVLLGDFEGIVNYVIGTNETGGMKVFTLHSPSRLVVDIKST